MSVHPINHFNPNHILSVLRFIRKGGSYPNYVEEKDSIKRTVELNACFLSIQDIENIKQRFVAVAQIEGIFTLFNNFKQQNLRSSNLKS